MQLRSGADQSSPWFDKANSSLIGVDGMTSIKAIYCVDSSFLILCSGFLLHLFSTFFFFSCSLFKNKRKKLKTMANNWIVSTWLLKQNSETRISVYLSVSDSIEIEVSQASTSSLQSYHQSTGSSCHTDRGKQKRIPGPTLTWLNIVLVGNWIECVAFQWIHHNCSK